MIRVLIVDDHGIIRAGLRSLLNQYEDIQVVGEAADGWEAIELATRLRPDVVLMDIAMPRLRGIEATAEIRQRLPETHVLALTVHDRKEYFFAILKAGGSGYVLKESEPEELLAAIRAVYQGDVYLSPGIARSVFSAYLNGGDEEAADRYESLTLREREVFQLVAEGRTTREIAEILHLSVKTVEKHRSSVMRKLRLQNLADLMKYAIRKGIVQA
ncbi:MAG TPA: response regulator transcription factor [Thermoflexia bacterium]|nr:response regulator transcription factor [Thermoflexia bacterium]